MPEEIRPARVAVIGCGHWGKNLVRNFAELGALAAVVDAHREVAEAAAARHGIAASSLETVLRDDSITGIVIAAPAEQHAELAGRALAAGKHVFVEKPLALKAADAAPLIEQAEARGRVLMVGHLLQYHPAFRRLLRAMRDGDLGRIQYIYSNRLNLGKIRREENVFWSFAPHDISMILALADELPTKVFTKGSYFLHEHIADVTSTTLSFSNGINAHIFVSWLHPFKEQKLVVVGDKAMAVFDDCLPWAEKLSLYPHRMEWREGAPMPNRAERISVPLTEEEPLREECRHFLEAIEAKAKPRTDGAEGLRVLRVLEAAQHSMNREVPVALDEVSPPESGYFVHESAYIDSPVEIGAGSKIWHFSHILGDTRIGKDCVIAQNVMIGPAVTVGDGCKIQNNVSLYRGVTLADDVFCGPSCVFTNVLTPRADVERKEEFKETPVGRGATIGANATIVCGHSIGAYAMVAAGAVVTRDVPDHALVAGVPARRIGWVSHAGERLEGDLVCPRSGRRYTERADGTLEEQVE